MTSSIDEIDNACDCVTAAPIVLDNLRRFAPSTPPGNPPGSVIYNWQTSYILIGRLQWRSDKVDYGKRRWVTLPNH